MLIAKRRMQQENVQKSSKIAGAGLIALLLILLLRDLPFQEYAVGLFKRIEEWGPLAPVACIVVYVVWVLCLLPGSVMTVGSGVLFGSWGIPIAVAGGLSASTAAFLIARHLGSDRVKNWAARNRNAQLLDRAIQESGWSVVFLARLSPIIPYNITNYFFGITSLTFRTYFTATLAGMLPGTALYAYAGSLGHRILTGEEKVGPIHYIFLGTGLAATVLLGFRLQRKLQEVAHRNRDATDGAPPPK